MLGAEAGGPCPVALVGELHRVGLVDGDIDAADVGDESVDAERLGQQSGVRLGSRVG